MTEFLTQLGSHWLAAYLVLAGVYLLVGVIVTRTNRWLGESKRIQQRRPSEKLIRRDFIQSLKSLVTISLFVAGGLSIREAGWGWSPLESTWVNESMLLIVSLIAFDTWFYWAHRLLHTRPFYKRIHAWHHRAVSPTVWSNNSDTFLDNCFAQSYWLVAPLILPVSSAVLIVHKLIDQVTGMLGHAGFEYAGGRSSAFPSPLLGVTFHDQHHEKFHYNFATHFSWWDRLMGTLDPAYDTKVTAFGVSTTRADRSRQA